MMLLIGLLFNSLWQGAAVLLAATVILAIARRSNATTRYVVWTSALALSAVLPIATALVPILTAPHASALPAAKPVAQAVAAHAAPPARAVAPLRVSSAAAPVRGRLQFALPPWAASAIGILWGLAALALALRFAMAVRILERLKRDAVPMPVEYRERLSRWQAQRNDNRPVRLCLSDEIRVPVAVGMFDAMILLPGALIEDLHSDDVDRIVLHEYAHLRRGDDWINAFERIALALLFFNPAVRYIARQMDIEREVSCDDSVVVDARDAVPLANCLVKMVERVEWPYQPLAAPGVFDTRRDLSLRVERLLLFTRDRRTRVALIPALSAVAAMFALVLMGSLISPEFVFAQQSPERMKTAAPVLVKVHPVGAVHPKVAATKHVEHSKVNAPAVVPNTTPMPARPMPKILPKNIHPKIAPAFAFDVRNKVQVRTDTSVGYKFKESGAPAKLDEDAPKTLASADYISELQAAGYSGLTVNELIELKSMGVTGAYIRQIEAAGFPHPTVHELVELRAGNVTPESMAKMRARFAALSLRQIAELGSMNVTGAYIDELASEGYGNLSEREVVEARAMNIDKAYIEAVKAHGFKNLTLRQLVNLKASGVL